MLPFLSLITSIKDYVEVVHKLIETDSNLAVNSYYDFGSVFTFVILSGKEFFQNFLTFQWFQNVWSIPTLVPDIASSLISEISVFDGYFQNTQTFLESPLSYGNQNFFLYCLEKFTIGFLNSLFLCFPTSIAHIITLRRFVMQGLEAGFISGLGTIVGNIVWIGSILFGFRFFVIPWLSLDLFRYFLGFLLIVKYMWDSSKERRMVLEDFSKYKIFFLTFLLSFTEQTTLYPFLSNLSFGSDSTLLETFPTDNFSQFTIVHCCYLLGLLFGSLSFLQFTCWFWENPAFQIYMWFLSSFQITKNISSKFVNFIFLYLTMICAIANFSYFGLDYTLTNPLGFVHEDRFLEQKAFLETAFLNTKASDRNTRRNRGRHGRRERWKRRIRKYRTFDASLYDQGVYDLFTIEDLNYGFDRFWLRRKIRNHRVRFRFFPGPWMRNFKKQLSRPRLESFLGPRVEFFRILFEQAYHPEFHEFSSRGEQSGLRETKKNILSIQTGLRQGGEAKNFEIQKTSTETQNFISWNIQGNKKQRILKERSAFRKFTRKIQTRLKRAKIESEIQNPQNFELSFESSKNVYKPLLPKSGVNNFSKTNKASPLFQKSEDSFYFQRFYKKLFAENSEKAQTNMSKKERFLQRYKNFLTNSNFSPSFANKGENEKISYHDADPSFSSATEEKKSKKEKTILFSSPELPLLTVSNSQEKITNEFFKTNRKNQLNSKQGNTLFVDQNESVYRPLTFLHPLQFYFQKEQALKRKFQFYGAKLFRNYGVENNAPYFRVFMKRFFYHYKPSLRWERTLRVASTRRARRKSSRIPKKLNIQKSTQILAEDTSNLSKHLYTEKTDPTHFYSLVDKRASRYRFQIYKDVLQHWYYSPFNRLLLKLDIDSFIRRQPNSYFLTKNDEKFLHFKRQLLSEYYETLRWYTSMENYSTMKNQIGGTKSLFSRAYNQQFAGTLKKIRHLFNMSPSFHETSVLKFDQPLYNEYSTSSQSGFLNSAEKSNGRLDFVPASHAGATPPSAFADSILHEELLSENFFSNDFSQPASLQTVMGADAQADQYEKNKDSSGNFTPSQNPENLVNQSITILREYLATAAPVRQQYIENLLIEKNYWELSRFLFRGQKIRGTRPITNETDFSFQEKNLLLTPPSESSSENTSFSTQFTDSANQDTLKDEIWISLFQKCQKKLYDQEALKNYVSLKKEKYEIQKQRHEKYLKSRITRIQKAVFQNSEVLQKKDSQEILTGAQKNEIQNFENFSGSPSSFKKALKESILWEKNSLSNSSFRTVEKIFGADEFNTFGKKLFLEKTNIRKNQFPFFSFLSQNTEKGTVSVPGETEFSSQTFQNQKTNRFFSLQGKRNSGKTREFIFTKNLHFVVKKQAIQILKAEKQVQEKFEKSHKNFTFFNISRIVNSVFQKTKHTFFVFRKKAIEIPFGSSAHKKNDISFFKEKNIDFWKKRENVLFKRKKLRKTLKRLRNQKTQTQKILFENSDFFASLSVQKNSKTENRQKKDTDLNKYIYTNSSRSWQNFLDTRNSSSVEQKGEKNRAQSANQKTFDFFGIRRASSKIGNSLFDKKFMRKRTRLRRYSSFKGRGPIKKRTLREKLKRQFKSLKKYGKTGNEVFSEKQKERENKKAELIQFITQRSFSSDGKFQKRDEKQRRTRQMKQRAWKKKKQNFAQKRRKLRKRRRSTVSKIRVYNKKIYRILSRKEIQTWWWKTFLPHFQKTTEKTWQSQKNKQIQKQLSELSEKEIFERDLKNKGNWENFQNGNSQIDISKMNSLQIGNKDFKPFALPESLRIREKLVQKNLLRFENSNGNEKNQNYSNTLFSEKKNELDFFEKSAKIKEEKNIHIFEKVNNSLLNQQDFFGGANQKTQKLTNSPFMAYTNPLPFYAGWDNGIRKFVLTNRFLARQNCFSCSALQNKTSSAENSQANRKENFDSAKSPLQGMNAATTLYWQIPFTTYDPDQFFALGMDGFSPLGWRNFSFKHSKQTTKPLLVKNMYSFGTEDSTGKTFSRDLRFKISTQTFSANSHFPKRKQEIDKNFEYRRILKKQKRLKKHPRPPVWFPSGSLSQQVLPVHYIYVFYKRSRLPRDRYIRRRLRTNFMHLHGEADNTQNSLQETSFSDRTKMIDFTLRKRTKPRRKYHRKRFGDGSEKTQFFQRRRKFRGFFDETETSRPTSKLFVQTSTGTKQEKKVLRSKQRRKIRDSKQANENIRVRQLRRRVQRQVYRPVWRSRPRAGGFVWPGDYLRFESVKASPLKSETISSHQPGRSAGEKMSAKKNETPFEFENSQSSPRKIRKKNRRTLQEWQIQPKRYFYEKHNLKVLKKRIEKSMTL